MNREFVDALQEVASARGIDKMQLVQAFEESLRQAYERTAAPNKRVEVHLDSETGELEVLIIREVVEKVDDINTQISFADALKEDPTVEIGMEMEFPEPQEKFSRIAVQITKQVIMQKMREAERNIVFNEYKDREGEVVNAQVARQDNKGNIFVDLGRGEAILPPKEQLPGERLPNGARIKVYLVEVKQTSRGPSILASRAAPELLAHLLRQEIPEIADNVVEIKAIAREPGGRSKVAVHSHSPNVDPIGACIGQRGSRIQAVTGELGRERVDIIQWDISPREFIRNALSPAKAASIETETEDNGRGRAKVTVSADQLSLAIGKGGQNVRLAAKLTGYRIDLRQAEGDLEVAMTEAVRGKPTPKASGRAAFEALFSATPEGEITDARPEAERLKDEEWFKKR